MKSLLMVALDFPPCKSAGVQRTVKFIEYLPQHGWQPSVLTAKPMIYDAVESEADCPDITTYRALGWNTLRHFSFKGKHFDWMLHPDRFFSWYWHAVMLGKQAIKQQKPDLLWSTFPCSTTMKIALTLKQYSGLPWIADFRDPFAGVNPYVSINNKPGMVIDKAVVTHADKLVFSTQRIADLYLQTYPELSAEKVTVITNGYNDEEFLAAQKRVSVTTKIGCFREKVQNHNSINLLHSGALYPNGRDPSALIKALALLQQTSASDDKINSLCQALSIQFRGIKADKPTSTLIAQHGLEQQVTYLPPVSYQDSISEMLETDALLLLQGEMFNNQVPGKAYEYLRSGKPILALTHADGATAHLLQPHPGVYIADMNDPQAIAAQLKQLLLHNTEYERNIACYSRAATAASLAQLLDGLVTLKASNAE